VACRPWYAAPIWMTFKQAAELGAYVRKSEHGRTLALALVHGVICPTGSFAKSLSSPLCKNISLSPSGKSSLQARPVPPRLRGTYASSRTLGAGCDGRGSDARRAALARTAKSCGPDAPTLASSFAKQSRGDGGNKARSPGRARRKPLKPLRREGRVKPVYLW